MPEKSLGSCLSIEWYQVHHIMPCNNSVFTSQLWHKKIIYYYDKISFTHLSIKSVPVLLGSHQKSSSCWWVCYTSHGTSERLSIFPEKKLKNPITKILRSNQNDLQEKITLLRYCQVTRNYFVSWKISLLVGEQPHSQEGKRRDLGTNLGAGEVTMGWYHFLGLTCEYWWLISKPRGVSSETKRTVETIQRRNIFHEQPMTTNLTCWMS